MQNVLNRVPHASLYRVSILSLTFCLYFTMLAVFILPNTANAAPKKGYDSLQVMAPKQGFVMAPGQEKRVLVGFQNKGPNTWSNTGRGFVSVYTYGPKYRTSVFQASNWVDHTQAALLQEPYVAPGEVGHILISLKAPNNKGVYEETFNLAAEDVAWIPGGEFALKIVVGEKQIKKNTKPSVQGSVGSKKTSNNSVASKVETTENTQGLSAFLLLRSSRNIKAKAGEEIQFKVGIKNIGDKSWNKREIRASDVAIASVNTKHSSWVTSTKVAVKNSGIVNKGSLDFIDFKFNAPKTKGKHVLRYRLAVDDVVVPDFHIDIPIEVTTGSAFIKNAPLIIQDEEDAIKTDRLIDEPIIRIGVLTVDEETSNQVEISCNSKWKLIDGKGGLLGNIEKDKMVRAFYHNYQYFFNRGHGIEKTMDYLRFVPEDKDAICTVENFDRRRTRRAAHADNQFRDILELRYNESKDRIWLINELPVEEYLYGLAETSNISHHEFKKSLLTAARTYAVYHFERATKHKSEYFHMNAYADDQVYKGYGHEQRHPNVRRATEDTRGITVNYDGSTAITPYYSRSDGRTRDWNEVWGGNVAWLKSVPAPCDARNNRKLWGHGVGMSASEALCMANEGSSWDEILQYFYKGIDLNKRWE